MAKYRKIDPRIWGDAKFMALSNEGKLVFLFLLTHPHMTSVGAMRGSLVGLAAELKWKAEAFAKAFREASGKAMVKVDFDANFIWLPNFLKYNAPESPNVIKSWISGFEDLPECDLKSQLYQSVGDYSKGLTEGFTEAFAIAFRKALPKTMPNQEHEQELKQELELKHEITPPTPKGEEPLLPGIDLSAWNDFDEYRKSTAALRKNWSPLAKRKAQELLAKHSPTEQQAMVDASIRSGWSGLFPDKKQAGKKPTADNFESKVYTSTADEDIPWMK